MRSSLTGFIAGSSLILTAGLLASSPVTALAASPSIAVDASGESLTITSLTAASGFGPDETLVVRPMGSDYSIALIGEDAQARLIPDPPCTGGGLEVICPINSITTVAIDFSRSTGATQTVIQVPLDVTFQGGSGEDYFQSSSGDDTLDGGAGNDVLFGDDEEGPFGDDTITGGPGDDVMYGYGGTNTLYAEDGERDSRVECADSEIAGSSGQATWDEGLDQPVLCEEIDTRPGPPSNFSAIAEGWREDTRRFTVNFLWLPPTFNAEQVASYRLTVLHKGKTILTRTLTRAVTTPIDLVNPEPGDYQATLVSVGKTGESAPATTTFSVWGLLSLPNVESLAIAAPKDARSAVQLTWKPPAGRIPGSGDRFSQFVTGYQIERKAADGFWDGPPQVIDLEPNRRIFTDSCIPPGITMEYRIRVKYRIYGASVDSYSSKWLERSERSAYVPSVPRPSTVSTGLVAVIPTDIPTGVGTTFDRVTVSSFITGGLAEPGECFGVSHQLQDRRAGHTYAIFEQRAGQGAPRQSVGPRRFSLLLGSTATQTFSLRSQRILDETWRQTYGLGFNTAGITGANYLLDQITSKSIVDLPGTAIYSGGGAGVKVRNLSASWVQYFGASGLSAEVSFDPPDSGDPNSTNVRGYEICISTDRARVYSPNYPVTSRINCSIYVPDTISSGVGSATITTVFGVDSWCTPGGYYSVAELCPLLQRNTYVQVRPWVGSVQLEAASDGTLWKDWNRHTWTAVKPR